RLPRQGPCRNTGPPPSDELIFSSRLTEAKKTGQSLSFWERVPAGRVRVLQATRSRPGYPHPLPLSRRERGDMPQGIHTPCLSLCARSIISRLATVYMA